LLLQQSLLFLFRPAPGRLLVLLALKLLSRLLFVLLPALEG
jgi:hypothetical protein